MKLKKAGIAILAGVVMTMSLTLSIMAFTHEADAWDYGVQARGIPFISREYRTYSNFYCPEQKHHATAVMDNETVRVVAEKGKTASAYTNYYSSYSTTHAYYGHD